MSENISTYPVLYDPVIKTLLDLKDMDFGLEQTLPTIDEIQSAQGIENPQSELVQSGILDDLNSMVNDSQEDFINTTKSIYTDDIMIKNQMEEDEEHYYRVRVFAQATMICDYLDGLVQLDNYPKAMFGDYKRTRNVLFATKNDFERARALNQLRIIARSIIPVKTREQRVEIVEPTLLSSTGVTEG